MLLSYAHRVLKMPTLTYELVVSVTLFLCMCVLFVSFLVGIHTILVQTHANNLYFHQVSAHKRQQKRKKAEETILCVCVVLG